MPAQQPAPATTVSLDASDPASGGPAAVQDPAWLAGPSDGRWQPAGRPVRGRPAVFTTQLRRGAAGLPVGVAWLDASLVRTEVYAGSSQPSGAWSHQAAVEHALFPSLVAAFNGGFQLAASRGGIYLDGRAAVPLRDGAASFVVYRDGSATVGQWGRDVSLTADVTSVRQNLSLLVDGGKPVSGLAVNIIGGWGATLGSRTFTWRSALGVDRDGDLLFVAGPALDPSTLASAAVAAGAIRAMEQDINAQWVAFDTFTVADGQPADAVVGTKLLPGMHYAPNHFLVPFWRDFVAVFARPAPPGRSRAE